MTEQDVIQINGGITINVNVSVKKRHVCEKDYVRNPATCNWKNGKSLASTIDDAAIVCYEVIESYEEDAEVKSYDETSFNQNKATCKTQNFCILLAFLSITIALLIVVSIYY